VSNVDLVAGLGIAFLLLCVLAGFVGFLWQRARRQARDTEGFKQAVADEAHLPPSLHPVIDPNVCIGSLSCITACPEGDILGVVDGVAKLIIGRNCIGHGRCAIECPVDAIKLVIGTSERGIEIPEVDTNFESSRQGVHVVGELGGMGLIKNAIRQGLQAAAYIGRELDGKTQSSCDVAIVGAGPAGLATAVGLRDAGVSFRVLEQGSFGGTIAHYPRQKVVMTERVTLPIYGRFGKPLISKEALLEAMQEMARKAKVTVEENVKVEAISGQDGAFVVQTSRGPVRARKVVLATGRRGSPRKLGVEGEDLAKVTYNLVDPEQYAGSRVLVVGGGDSALEAAIALAEHGSVDVAISYRNDAFGKCRDANRRRIAELIKSGEVEAFMKSTVQRIDAEAVTLRHQERDKVLPNDFIIACLGGELPAAFLKSVGVDLARHAGDKTIQMPGLPRARTEGRGPSTLAIGLFCIGVTILFGLAWVGHDYYLLDRQARARAPLHDFLRSSGPWGHGVGIGATLFMMLNFVYPLRKRLGFLKGTAPIRSWLTFHVFVGIMSPLTIGFHAAFQSRNHLATGTFAALCIVVLTGLIGRFVFGLVPSVGGTAVELSMVRAQLQRERLRLRPREDRTASDFSLERMLRNIDVEPTATRSLFAHMLRMPWEGVRTRLQLFSVRRRFETRDEHREFVRSYLAARRLHMQVSFYGSLKRLLSGWRVFHVVLSVMLVVVILFHVGLSIYLGYRWIF
jgi:dihydropyrimidine dehydrogenase (NAD+) subunit PreT